MFFVLLLLNSEDRYAGMIRKFLYKQNQEKYQKKRKRLITKLMSKKKKKKKKMTLDGDCEYDNVSHNFI